MPLPLNGLWRFVFERMTIPPGDVELEVSVWARRIYVKARLVNRDASIGAEYFRILA
jgi:hypothetical protein